MNILVTGAAGFIGFHLTLALLKQGNYVVGFDNLNDYYDTNLKLARLEILKQFKSFVFVKADLTDKASVEEVFDKYEFERVVNLAAQAGVRHSLKHPEDYINSNITGFLNILEACRYHKTAHLIYASSSSVYGLNTVMPFSVHDNVDHPVSIYAVTKKTNELMAHSYSHLYGIPTTGLRFFTVYGPWGRPDMSLFIFTKAILENKPIKVFNNGQMMRSFTYVDDIVEGIVKLLDVIPQPDKAWKKSASSDAANSSAPYSLYNIGNDKPVKLLEFIEAIENKLGKKAEKEFLPMQIGDIEATYADVTELVKKTGFSPKTPLDIGVSNFVDWYLAYYSDKS